MGFVARHPSLSLALILFVLAVPAVVLRRREQFVRRYVTGVFGLLCVLAVGRAIVYLVRLRPVVEGVDFFSLLCVARDRNHGATDLSPWRYAYFPGAQMFWRAALGLGGETLAGAQWMYAALLFANAALLGATVWRTVKSWLGAAIVAVGYVALVSRLEGGYGVAEPIAMLPVAAAVLVWGGEPLQGRRGLVLAAVLGAGIGLGVYVKQQGAFQAAGWLALPLGNFYERRHQWRAILLVPLVAIVVFFIGILAEGKGLFPLRIGIETVMAYATQSSFWANLTEIADQVKPLLFAFLLALPATAILLVRDRSARNQPWVSVALFAFLIVAASLYQFSKRAYHHYALLTAPWLLLCVVLSAVSVWRALPNHEAPAIRFAALLLAALAFVHTSDPASDAFFLWPPHRIEQPMLGHWRTHPLFSDDMQKLGQFIHRGEDVLVLPPRHNEIHFLFGTRSVSWEQGYTWGVGPAPAAKALSSPTLQAVILIAVRDPSDEWTWNWHKCDEAAKNLRQSGFRPVVQLKTMAVWRRH